ncbi:hypothetical protein [Halorussus ruber]|uniref:hypothetical protein n=1 Tax=Halorussus ruber TaxID=1126238 RepID=UPI0010925FEF|nr:hypothetical protein [Halorussus ruber]
MALLLARIAGLEVGVQNRVFEVDALVGARVVLAVNLERAAVASERPVLGVVEADLDVALLDRESRLSKK